MSTSLYQAGKDEAFASIEAARALLPKLKVGVVKQADLDEYAELCKSLYTNSEDIQLQLRLWERKREDYVARNNPKRDTLKDFLDKEKTDPNGGVAIASIAVNMLNRLKAAHRELTASLAAANEQFANLREQSTLDAASPTEARTPHASELTLYQDDRTQEPATPPAFRTAAAVPTHQQPSNPDATLEAQPVPTSETVSQGISILSPPTQTRTPQPLASVAQEMATPAFIRRPQIPNSPKLDAWAELTTLSDRSLVIETPKRLPAIPPTIASDTHTAPAQPTQRICQMTPSMELESLMTRTRIATSMEPWSHPIAGQPVTSMETWNQPTATQPVTSMETWNRPMVSTQELVRPKTAHLTQLLPPTMASQSTQMFPLPTPAPPTQLLPPTMASQSTQMFPQPTMLHPTQLLTPPMATHPTQMFLQPTMAPPTQLLPPPMATHPTQMFLQPTMAHPTQQLPSQTAMHPAQQLQQPTIARPTQLFPQPVTYQGVPVSQMTIPHSVQHFPYQSQQPQAASMPIPNYTQAAYTGQNVHPQATLHGLHQPLQPMQCAQPMAQSQQFGFAMPQYMASQLKLDLPKFDGTPRKFRSFWQSFRIIHEEPTMSKQRKLITLLSLLTGNTKRKLEHLDTIDENYDIAVAELHTEFGNTVKAACDLQASLSKIPTRGAVGNDLESVFEVETTLKQMVAHGIQVENFATLCMIRDRLPTEIYRSMVRKGLPETVSETRVMAQRLYEQELLLKRDADERRSKPETKKRENDQSKTSLDSNNAVSKCVFCGRHSSRSDCRTVKDPSSRRNILTTQNRCFKCFSDSHDSRNCPVKTMCTRCNGNHHRFVCQNQQRTTAANDVSQPAAPRAAPRPAQPPAQQVPQVQQAPQPRAAANRRDQPRQVNAVGAVEENEDEVENEDDEDPLFVGATNSSPDDSSEVLLITTMTTAQNPATTEETQTMIFIDPGSQGSFIHRSVAESLQLKSERSAIITIQPFESEPVKKRTNVVKVNLKLQDGSWRALSCYVVDSLAGKTKCCSSTYQLPGDTKRVKITKSTPGVLLGMDQLADITHLELTKDPESGQCSFKTAFGLIPVGPTNKNVNSTPTMNVGSLLIAGDDSTKAELDWLWRVDKIGIFEDPADVERDDKAAELLEKSIKVLPDGRYEVELPLRYKNPKFTNCNFNVAKARLFHLVEELKKHNLLRDYNGMLNQHLEDDVIEEIPFESIDLAKGEAYIMPSKFVLRTGKNLRVVFDAGSKAKGSLSVNDVLLRGPVLLSKIFHLLINCRLSPNLLSGDVKAAFHQVQLGEASRNLTCFLWLKDINKGITMDNIRLFRFKRVPFGMKCSPFLLAGVMQHHLNRQTDPLGKEIINNVYVDNLFMSFTDPGDGIDKYKKSKELFAEANMVLREFVSSCPEVNERLKAMGEAEPPELCKILGYLWRHSNDTLSLTAFPGREQQPEKITKRKALSAVAKYFDPLGLLCPTVIAAKKFLQSISSKPWDEELSEAAACWSALIEAKEDCEFDIPRSVAKSNFKSTPHVLHIFTDASDQAFGACVYLHVKDGSRPSLLLAKSRISPKNKITMPRLELLGIITGIRLKKELEKLGFENSNAVLWTDSACCWHWIHSETPQANFIQERLNEIRGTSNLTVRFVRTHDNPADLATRACTATMLKQQWDMWTHGPRWLQEDESGWPENLTPGKPRGDEYEVEIDVSAAQIKKVNEMAKLPEPIHVLNLDRLCHKPNAHTLSKVLSLAHRVLTLIKKWRLRCNHNPDRFSKLNRWGLVVKCVQSEFPPEYSDVVKMGIAADESGILRCHPRMDNSEMTKDAKRPIWLPRQSTVTLLILNHVHHKNLHVGVKQTLSLAREKFWIPQGQKTTMKAIRNFCHWCTKNSVLPYALPLMPELPQCRVVRSLPFTHCGFDYAGPLAIKSKDGTDKAWIALITCLATRAVHLELVESLSAEAAINAIRRMIARRGKPKTIISDNATNFTLAAQQLTKLWQNFKVPEELISYCTSESISWKFITPAAPWQGGVYERLIGIMKKSLQSAIGKSVPNADELRTLLAETEAVVNCRPLTTVGSDPDTMNCLRPADFLNPGAKFGIPTVDEEAIEDGDYVPPEAKSVDKLHHHFQKSLKCLDKLWKYWNKSYLELLMERNVRDHRASTRTSSKKPEVDQVVMIQGDKLPRGLWNVARIKEIHLRRDGEIRDVTVVLPNGKELRRTLNLLYPLEMDGFDNPPAEPENDGISDNDPTPVVPARRSKRLQSREANDIDDPPTEPGNNDVTDNDPAPVVPLRRSKRLQTKACTALFLAICALIIAPGHGNDTVMPVIQSLWCDNGILHAVTSNAVKAVIEVKHRQKDLTVNGNIIECNIPAQLLLHDTPATITVFDRHGQQATKSTTCNAIDDACGHVNAVNRWVANVQCWSWPVSAMILILLLGITAILVFICLTRITRRPPEGSSPKNNADEISLKSVAPSMRSWKQQIPAVIVLCTLFGNSMGCYDTATMLVDGTVEAFTTVLFNVFFGKTRNFHG